MNNSGFISVKPDPFGGGFARMWEYGGVEFTIDKMRKMVFEALTWEQDGLIRKHVETIIAAVRPKDYLSEVAAIYYYCLKNIRYTRDPMHVEFVTSPLKLLVKNPWDAQAGRSAGQEDCEAISTAIATAVISIGNPAEFVTITTKTFGGFHHVFCVTTLPDGRKAVLDPIPGPYTNAMLKAVKRWQRWPVEPVRSANSPSWGVAGAPVYTGEGIQSLQKSLYTR